MRLMGIVNVTPDSFSDGGLHAETDTAVAFGLRLRAEGAEILDVGGESTRPGAPEVPVAEELRRVVPVVRALVDAGAEVSVDTRKAAVAAAALDAGATWVNDVSGGADPAMFGVVGAARYVLMHTRGTPATMAGQTDYTDVCAEVWGWLDTRLAESGLDPARVLLDPGIGFAKTAAQNVVLLRDLPARTTRPVLLGASRKSFIGALTGQVDPATRLEGSLAVALHARTAGVAVLRVHDVAATVRALRVWDALNTRAPA